MSDELTLLDGMVEEYGMNVYLCTHTSRHTPNGEGVSDVLHSTLEQFVVRGIANKEYGMPYSALDFWGPKECLTFYSENLLDADGRLHGHLVKHITSNTVLEGMLSGCPAHARSAFAYRIQEGYAFLNYRQRVDRFLVKVVQDNVSQGRNLIASLETAKASLDRLRGDSKKLHRTGVSTDRLNKLIKHVVENLTISDVVEIGLVEEDES